MLRKYFFSEVKRHDIQVDIKKRWSGSQWWYRERTFDDDKLWVIAVNISDSGVWPATSRLSQRSWFNLAASCWTTGHNVLDVVSKNIATRAHYACSCHRHIWLWCWVQEQRAISYVFRSLTPQTQVSIIVTISLCSTAWFLMIVRPVSLSRQGRSGHLANVVLSVMNICIRTYLQFWSLGLMVSFSLTNSDLSKIESSTEVTGPTIHKTRSWRIQDKYFCHY